MARRPVFFHHGHVSRSSQGERWTSPSGLSAIAAVLAVLVAVVGLFVARSGGDPAASGDRSSEQRTESSADTTLFVYGSSQPGQSRYSAIERYVDSYEEDTVSGWLYDSGMDYPLAKFGPGDTIPGYVLRLAPGTAEEAMREFTRVEAGLFHPVEVTTDGKVRATAFEWIESTDGFERISSWPPD